MPASSGSCFGVRRSRFHNLCFRFIVLDSDMWAALGDVLSLVFGFNRFIMVQLVTTSTASFKGGARKACKNTIGRAIHLMQGL